MLALPFHTLATQIVALRFQAPHRVQNFTSAIGTSENFFFFGGGREGGCRSKGGE